jgi:hypothetical protein
MALGLPRWLRSTTVGLALFACGAEQHAPRNTPLAFIVPEHETNEAADPELDAALGQVARARGLEFRRRPLLGRVSRATLVRHALAWLDTQTPEPTRRAEAALLTALELVPADFSWHTALAGELEARLSAFYDSQLGKIWLDESLPTGTRRRVLAHELVHVLADQHHGLGRRLAAASSSADARAALLAVAEGDAEVLVQELEAAGLVAPRSAGADAPGPPSVLERSQAAAYADGYALVRRVFDSGGWTHVDALYAAPPASTHALSNPDFPGAPEVLPGLTRTPRRAPAAEGWSLVADETLGERAWRVILEEWAPATRAFEIARRWQDDRLTCFERGPRRALVWEVRADAPAMSAAEAVLREGMHLPPPSTASRRASGTSCRAHRDGGVVGLWRRGRSLFIAASSDVPARDGCGSLTRWVEQLEADDDGAADPGLQRLTGPV